MVSIGDTAEAVLTVRQSDTAEALALASEDAFPAAFSTSRMVALMEIAAARVLTPLLQPSELTDGVALAIKHTAATPVGCRVQAVATYLGPQDKFFRFRVEAFDEAGLVGEGEHSRAIVTTERLMAGAEKRRR